MCFFYYLHITFGEFGNLIKTATFQTSSDVWHNRHRVWSIIQQVKKKQSHNVYHFLGLSGNLYMIYLVKLIKLDVLGDSNRNGNGGGLIYPFIAYSGGVLM